MAAKEIQPEDMILLNRYRAIYYSYPMNHRAKHFNQEDGQLFENIYNRWRGTSEHVVGDCDACYEEIFERLMLQMLSQEKPRVEFGVLETSKLKENLRPIVQRKLEKQN